MDGVGEPVPPDVAFWLLGEETRLAILQAVWETEEGLPSFTEIRDRRRLSLGRIVQ